MCSIEIFQDEGLAIQMLCSRQVLSITKSTKVFPEISLTFPVLDRFFILLIHPQFNSCAGDITHKLTPTWLCSRDLLYFPPLVFFLSQNQMFSSYLLSSGLSCALKQDNNQHVFRFVCYRKYVKIRNKSYRYTYNSQTN